MALSLRNRVVTTNENENAENAPSMFRTKQHSMNTKPNVGTEKVGEKGLKGGVARNPLGGTRLALGNVVNNINSREGQSKMTEFGAIKKQGYGSQNQSRIVKKPDARPPLRSNSSVSIKSKSDEVPKKVGGKTSLSGKTSVFGDLLNRRPLTRSTASSSLTSLRDVPAPIKVDATIKEEEPVLVTARENKIDEVQNAKIQTLQTPDEDAISQCSSNLVSSDREPDSGAYSAAMIKDIDEEDREDPQLVADYVNDVYIYLRHLEKQQNVEEDYLSGQKEITGKMRAILIDWLVQVHIRFHLLPETLYMTIMLIDRYLQSAATVPKSKLQLVGVSAMFVASKYEEMFAPEIGDFEYITDHSYRCQEIRLMEIEILKTLKFEIGRPLPIHFLRRFSKAAEADADIHSMAKYFMELCIVEYSMCHFLPSVKAAAALWISLKLLVQDKWCDTLIHYTGYREDDIMPCVRKMSRLIYKTHIDKTKFQSVRNKFATNRFRSISKHRSLENMEQIKMFGEGAQL